jgi:hypothetical protein
MKRIRAAVVLVGLMTALLLACSSALAQPSDEPVPSAAPARRGYAYPIAWLLPLVFVVGAGAVGRTLTRDLRTSR